MIITPFTRKIVFKVEENLLIKVEDVLKNWCSIIPGKSPYLIDSMYNKLFPLKSTFTYAFDVTWNQPIGILFSNWANEHNSFWIYIQNEKDLGDFEAILRLNVNSHYNRITPEMSQSLKETMYTGGVLVVPSTIS